MRPVANVGVGSTLKLTPEKDVIAWVEELPAAGFASGGYTPNAVNRRLAPVFARSARPTPGVLLAMTGLVLPGCFMSGDYQIAPGPVASASESNAPVGSSAPSVSGAGSAPSGSSGPVPSAQPSSEASSTAAVNPSTTPTSSVMPTSSALPSSATGAPSATLDGGTPQALPLTPQEVLDNPVAFSGGEAFPDCGLGLDAPYRGAWVAVSDGTREATIVGGYPGHGDGLDCAVHMQGRDLSDWGGGAVVAFDESETGTLTLDASGYTGIRLWLKGSTSGSYAEGYKPGPNWLRVQVKTGTDVGQEDWGMFCSVRPIDWTLCEIPFADVAWEQGDAPYLFDASELRGLGLIVAAAGGIARVTFDVWIDDVSFY